MVSFCHVAFSDSDETKFNEPENLLVFLSKREQVKERRKREREGNERERERERETERETDGEKERERERERERHYKTVWCQLIYIYIIED